MSLDDDYKAALEGENEKLRERIAALEEILGVSIEAPLVFGLTPSESQLFGLLYRRDLVTKDMAMSLLYGARSGEAAADKIVDVFICKMRAKLKRFGIEVVTLWGSGYAMTKETKAAVSAMMPQAAA